MDKVIGWLLVASALLSVYYSYLDPDKIFIG
jgi:hypothetical protein